MVKTGRHLAGRRSVAECGGVPFGVHRAATRVDVAGESASPQCPQRLGQERRAAHHGGDGEASGGQPRGRGRRRSVRARTRRRSRQPLRRLLDGRGPRGRSRRHPSVPPTSGLRHSRRRFRWARAGVRRPPAALRPLDEVGRPALRRLREPAEPSRWEPMTLLTGQGRVYRGDRTRHRSSGPGVGGRGVFSREVRCDSTTRSGS